LAVQAQTKKLATHQQQQVRWCCEKQSSHQHAKDFQDTGAIRAFLPPHFTNGGAYTYTKPQRLVLAASVLSLEL